jgi:hypothetical protein
MYTINNLQFYFLFMAQKSICFGIPVLLNYPCTLSPQLPQLIKSMLYVDLNRDRLNYTMIIVVIEVFRLPQHLVFWVVTPRSLVGGYQRFGGIHCLHV